MQIEKNIIYKFIYNRYKKKRSKIKVNKKKKKNSKQRKDRNKLIEN